MRLLLISQYFWPENFRINEIARDLKRSGHTVEVLTGQPNYPDGKFFKGYGKRKKNQEHWEGIPVFRLPIIARGKNNPFRLALNYLSFILLGLIYSPLLLRMKSYDVIFVYAPSPVFQVIPASFFGWLRNIPVVLWVQDLWPQSASATGHIQSPFLLKILEKAVVFSYRHTDLLLAQSQAFIPHIQQLNHSKIPVKYLPNSVDDSFLLVPHKNQATADEAEYFDIVFAGNIGTAQSIETIVAAAEKLISYPKIRFLIYGQGSKLTWLESAIFNKKLQNIVLCGQRPLEEMPALLQQSSVLLVTLAKQPIFTLTIPSKLQAYLAAGKPIIACLDGEGARIVEEAKAGLTAPAEDAQKLVEAVIKIYHTRAEELMEMGHNAQNYFKMHYKHDLVMNMLIHYLEEAIQHYRGKPF